MSDELLECFIEDSPNIITLRSITEELRFSKILYTHSGSDWQQIKVEQGTAFIRGLLKIDEIAVVDNYASADCIYPMHQHPAHEIFIVYIGKMLLNVNNEKIEIKRDGKPYYFDARQMHSAYFPVESKFIAVTIPADADWPEGA